MRAVAFCKRRFGGPFENLQGSCSELHPASIDLGKDDKVFACRLAGSADGRLIAVYAQEVFSTSEVQAQCPTEQECPFTKSLQLKNGPWP